ncbi:MAG: hypothetical protein ACQEVA_05910 [Myxococcota bacterium]
MKNLRRIFGFCLVLAASAGLVVACGPTTSTECSFDTDCADGEACLQPTNDDNRCVTDCTTDANLCANPDACSERYEAGDGVQVCVPDDVLCSGNEDCPGDITCGDDGFCAVGTDAPECETNDDCSGDDICNEDGVCEAPAGQTYFFLEITDTTDPASDACTAVDDPGSDLLTAEIIIDDIDPGIWARTTNWAPVANDFDTPPSHLSDGVAPPYDIGASMCPDSFADDTVLTLGCGGKAWIEFRDGTDTRVEIPTDGTADVYVYEYGSPLCGDDTADTYKVELCELTESDITGATAPDDIDCTGLEIIGSGQGEGSATDITL